MLAKYISVNATKHITKETARFPFMDILGLSFINNFFFYSDTVNVILVHVGLRFPPLHSLLINQSLNTTGIHEIPLS